MATRTWNDEDDAAYWAERSVALAEPVDPSVALNAAEDKLSRYRFSGESLLRELVPELETTVARLRPIVDARNAAFLAPEDAEWTRDVTIERRARWNEAVKGGRYSTPKGGIHVANLVTAMGFAAETLKRHVARHGL